MTRESRKGLTAEVDPTDARAEPPQPPRRSMIRLTQKWSLEGDPRAKYTRALINMGRVGDVAYLLAPAEVVQAFCEAVMEPLQLLAAVVIEAPDGLPRSIPWKADHADWKVSEWADRRAWTYFAELIAPDLLSVLPPESASSEEERSLHWTLQPLAVPVLGVVLYATARPPSGADNGLLKYMSVRLSTALAANKVESRRGPPSSSGL